MTRETEPSKDEPKLRLQSKAKEQSKQITKSRMMVKSNDKELAKFDRMEIFYSFSGLQKAPKFISHIKTKIPSDLVDRQLNPTFFLHLELKLAQ